MSWIKSDFKCPKCNKKNRYKIYDEITDVDKVIDRSLFTYKCSLCSENIVLDYPLIIRRDNYVIYYTPSSNKDIKDSSPIIKRVCDTYSDLKEKILILEDNLDDIIIEFIKSFLTSQLDQNIKKEMTDIRYNSKDKDILIFSLLGVEQNISCSVKFYEDLIKRSKCKKIKNVVVVDEQTFRKYFKLR